MMEVSGPDNNLFEKITAFVPIPDLFDLNRDVNSRESRNLAGKHASVTAFVVSTIFNIISDTDISEIVHASGLVAVLFSVAVFKDRVNARTLKKTKK